MCQTGTIRYTSSIGQSIPEDVYLRNTGGSPVALAHSAFVAKPPEQDKWIPVGDGVPEEYECKEVLIAWRDEQRASTGFQTTSYEWCDKFGKVLKNKPTHWQPMPEPPK